MSPIETFLQKMNYFPNYFPEDDDFGNLLLDNGISREIIYYWSTNPSIDNKPIFDLFNGLTKSECLIKALELNSKCINIVDLKKYQRKNKNKNNEQEKSKNSTSNPIFDNSKVDHEALTQSQQDILAYEAELISLVVIFNLSIIYSFFITLIV